MSEISNVSAVDEAPVLKYDDCKCCSESEKVQVYEVVFVLTDKFFNEELGKYLFSYENNGQVLVSSTPEIKVVTPNYWRITDYLYNDGIKELSIKKLD